MASERNAAHPKSINCRLQILILNLRNLLPQQYDNFALPNGPLRKKQKNLSSQFNDLVDVLHYANQLKVGFSQKELMRSSFLQTDEPNYFP